MLSFTCPECGKPLKVKEELAGKKVKCPGCGAAVLVPTAVANMGTAPANQGRGNQRPEQRQHLQDQPTAPPRDHEPATQPPPDASDATHDPSSPDPDHDSSLTDFLGPRQADDELGRLGKFRILKVLGHGGMGVVFLGEDPSLGRKVAIKAMLPHLAASKTSQQRFLREAKAAAALEHDHIVPILHVDEDRGAPFIVMPFLKGEPLDKRLQREPMPPLADTLRIAREVAEALAAAHAAGLMHRDIKPANVWLESRESRDQSREPDKATALDSRLSALHFSRVKVLDFGLARATSEQAHLTQSGAIVGTPAYMAPEQARGEKVDGRCDLWSLGVMLYRMTTGKLPFTAADSVSTLVAIAMDDAKPVRELNPDIPEGLETLIRDLMRKDAKDRIGSAAEVVARLRALEASLSPLSP